MKYAILGLLALILAACGSKPSILERSNQYAVTIGNYCSGQFIDSVRDLVATAAHCVRGNETADIPIFLRVFDENGVNITTYQYTAKVAAKDEDHDVAILILTSGNYIFDPVVISHKEVHYGDLVFTVGNPYMFYRTIAEGKIIKVGLTIEGSTLVDAYLIDAFMAPGSSGGALLNEDGELIGLTNWGLGGMGNPVTGGAANVKWLIKLLETIDG